ncbi:hypothetical protein Q7P37_003152 [Cladosporium fusiforme]
MEEHFDVVILGSGQAGNKLLGFFTSIGKTVALIERKMIGGSCINIACLPSKNLIHSANEIHVAQQAKQSGLYEIELGKVNLHIAAEKKRAMVRKLNDHLTTMFTGAGAVIIGGQGRFMGPKKLEVKSAELTRIITGDMVIINVGTSAHIPSIPGLLESHPLTHIEALELDQVPKHLLILGGGYIGLEFAQMMKRFGSKVSVIVRSDRILKNEDEDVSTALMDLLQAEGVQFYLSAKPIRVEGQSGKQITMTLSKDGEETSITGTHLLCATGRVPNTSSIDLVESGIKLTGTGHIAVDEHLRTNVEGVFAVAECAGSAQFTHVSVDDGRVVRSYILNGEAGKTTTNRLIPSTLFTSPELSHVGAREHELRSQGIDYRLGKIPAGGLLRNLATGETEGFIKVMVAADSDEILGFTALSAQSGEMLPPIQIAMQQRLPYTEIADLIMCHPTYTEGLLNLFETVPSRK